MSQSQSDYIKHKKITNELKYQKDLPKVLTSNFYTRCVQYAIGAPIKKGCPIFEMCTNTEKRPNRKYVYNETNYELVFPPVSYSPLFVKDNKPKICC
jgi:hypothetical protein